LFVVAAEMYFLGTAEVQSTSSAQIVAVVPFHAEAAPGKTVLVVA
jgi:hypothetical protein